ncbi:uncharacterized protein LOC108459099 [Gossypium arboreum]|uniref:uncharacterized protein LOC108459099 n=1 Tax=Gossypium arboreum TaxID=29729 RepID=UPI0008190FF7|nr:uncharacterized protein LOC108459099 [Gossypium arboreum]
MSSRGSHGRGTRLCRGRQRGARVESSFMGSMPNLETSVTVDTPTTETVSQTRTTGDETLGAIGVAPTIAEYWLEATEHIMTNLDFTPTQKLRGAESLLRDKAYQWWLTVEQGAQPEQVNWDYFKNTLEGKYVGASYVKACRREFMSLVQGDRSVVEYEAEFLRLSKNARALVASNYNKCVRFEEGLRYDLRVMIALKREQVFAVLVDKSNIMEKVKRTEREWRDR